MRSITHKGSQPAGQNISRVLRAGPGEAGPREGFPLALLARVGKQGPCSSLLRLLNPLLGMSAPAHSPSGVASGFPSARRSHRQSPESAGGHPFPAQVESSEFGGNRLLTLSIGEQVALIF